MDSPADLRPKHVVDEPVLGNPSQTLERWGDDSGIEVMPVTGDLGTRSRNPRLDSSFQLSGVTDIPSSVAICCRYTE